MDPGSRFAWPGRRSSGVRAFARPGSSPGGQWRTTVQTPDGQRRTISGIYRAIEPPRRLVFTWGWLGDDGTRGHETEVTVTFEPVPGGTRLVLRQQQFESRESLERHGQGWLSSFDRLARAAE
jgi:uncharacterized protein YndB with AHSA1/START domain